MPSYEQRHARHWAGVRNPLWWIFCMPGAVFMWLAYWFPGRGWVIISGRQYGNRFVQFVYTLAGYIFVGLFLLSTH